MTVKVEDLEDVKVEELPQVGHGSQHAQAHPSHVLKCRYHPGYRLRYNEPLLPIHMYKIRSADVAGLDGEDGKEDSCSVKHQRC